MTRRGRSRSQVSRRGRAPVYVVLLVSGLLALVAAGCTEQPSVTRAPSGQPSQAAGFVAGDGTVTVISDSERKPAPSLVGDTLGGGSYRLADQKGKVVVLNVWGSWCAPCRKEAPDLQAAYTKLRERLGTQSVAFLGINTRDDSPVPAEAFQRRFGITYPSVFDPSGRELLGFAGSLPASAIPSTLVIDKQGRVAARVLGSVTTATLVGLVSDVAAS